MFFGEPGTKLLQDLRSKKFKKYNEKDMKALQSENTQLLNEMEDIKSRILPDEEISTEVSMNYILLKKCYDRNIRIQKSYLYHRFNKISNDIIVSKLIKDEFLNTSEVEMKKEYEKVLKEYLSNYHELDWTNNEPPLDYFVTILTLEECGMVENDGELIELEKNKIYYIKKKSIAHLLKSKLVKIIK